MDRGTHDHRWLLRGGFCGDGFRVKYHADELEQSQEIAQDEFSGISMLKALSWTGLIWNLKPVPRSIYTEHKAAASS